MSGVATTTGFDYAARAIPPAAEKRLEKYAAVVEESRASAVNNFMCVCEAVAAAHGEFANHGNGCFGEWVHDRLSMSRRAAEYMLSVHRRFGNCEIDFANFDQGSLLLLASDEIGDDVRQTILDAGNSGTPITQATVKGYTKLLDAADTGKDGDAAAADLLKRAAAGERITKRVVDAIANDHGIEFVTPQPKEHPRLALDEAIAETRASIESLIGEFPSDGRDILVAMLRRYADDIEKGGEHGDY